MTEKRKILTLGDHPFVPSGVGSQCRYLFDGLLKTGKYSIRSLGGAMKHQDYRPQKTKEYEDDWIIYPVDGYGNEQIIRNVLDNENIDAIHFTTDPRFYGWLFNMSDEIRDRGIPLLYWHVWDDEPTPHFNKGFYQSCDYVGCISKLTYKILLDLGFENSSGYIPHASDANIFKPFSKEEIMAKKKEFLKEHANKFVVFYNSRNARRKKTSDVLKTFKELTNRVGKDNCFLLMKTDPHDQEGGNLIEVAKMLEIPPNQIGFYPKGISQEEMAMLYNISDITVCHSSNEGFGLSCQESLYCGTPVVVMKTGGLQEQPIDNEGNVYGVLVEPVARSLQGSQQIPYIFDDHGSDEDFVNAYKKMYDMGFDARKELGRKGSEWVRKAYSMDNMVKSWDDVITKYVSLYRENKNVSRIKLSRI
jgi:glycosyltransferase involved in cell wall biosynthesis